MRNKTDIYFKKDKTAKIYHLEHEGTDVYGVTDRYYRNISLYPLWCYTSQLSQEKMQIAMALDSKETRFFVFNNQSNAGRKIDLHDYILYKDKWYRITRIDTKDDYNTDLFIYVEDDNEPNHKEYGEA